MFRGNWRGTSGGGGGGGGSTEDVWASHSSSSTFTFTGTTNSVKCDVSSNPVTIQLPAASGNTGKVFRIKHYLGPIETNNITISSAGGTIDGLATIVVSQNKSNTRVSSDGANWIIG